MRSKCNILFVFIFLLCNCTDEKSDDINPSKDLATTLSAGINKAISSYTYNSQTYHLEFENNSLSNVFTTNSDLRINMTKLPLSFTIMYMEIGL